MFSTEYFYLVAGLREWALDSDTKGFDVREIIDEIVDEEISLGDFVLTGGEIPACIVTDAVARLVDGVLSDAECYEKESISNQQNDTDNSKKKLKEIGWIHTFNWTEYIKENDEIIKKYNEKVI